MQITYRVSEAQYRQACKMQVKGGFRKKIFRIFMFWLFILISLMLLWAVVQKTQHPSSQPTVSAPAQGDEDTSAAPVATNNTSTGHALLYNGGPFLLILGIWAFMFFQLGPRANRRRYRNDPSMQGQFTIDVTPSGISIENTAGTSGRAVWNIFEYWREGRDVMVLTYKSGASFLISLAQLSDAQRNELRAMVSSALPRG